MLRTLLTCCLGPTAGGPFPEGDPAPRAVTKEYWDLVCPSPRVISSYEVSDQLKPEATALEILEGWVQKLDEVSDRCVEVSRESLQLFGIWSDIIKTNEIKVITLTPILI